MDMSPKLRVLLREPFGGGPGDPEFQFREVSLNLQDERLLLQGDVEISPGGRVEVWRVSLSFEEEDYQAALLGAPASALSWFVLMVRENIIEWWHTRKLEPNMPFAARRIE